MRRRPVGPTTRREWRPASPSTSAGVLGPAAPRPGRPDLPHDRRRRRSGAPATTPGRARDDRVCPPRRRHRRDAGVGPGRGVVARRPARPARRRRRPRRRSSPTTRWSPTRTGACPGCGSAPPGRVWDVLVPGGAGAEGHRHRGAPVVARAVPPLRRPRARPGARGMRVPPTPAQIRDGARLGVAPRGRRLRPAPRDPGRARRSRTGWSGPSTLGGEAGRELLRHVPGIGVWTAAEVAQRAWGDPDAVSVGDFHIPAWSAGRCSAARSTTRQMLRCSRPYAPQRQRAVRYVEPSGFRTPAVRPAVLPARLPRDVARRRLGP